MKFMNNHYGQSIIFKHARKVVPDGGEGLGDDLGVDGSGGGSGGTDSVSDDPEDDAPSIDDLQAQLAKAKADLEKAKNANNKLSTENANFRKEKRAMMTDEQKKAADLEAVNQELEELRRESRITKYSKRLIGIGMGESEADELASVIPALDDADAFFDGLSDFVESIKKSSGEEAVQKLLKERPEINAGNGDSQKDDPSMTLAKKLVEQGKASNKAANVDIINNFT